MFLVSDDKTQRDDGCGQFRRLKIYATWRPGLFRVSNNVMYRIWHIMMLFSVIQWIIWYHYCLFICKKRLFDNALIREKLSRQPKNGYRLAIFIGTMLVDLIFWMGRISFPFCLSFQNCFSFIEIAEHQNRYITFAIMKP